MSGLTPRAKVTIGDVEFDPAVRTMSAGGRKTPLDQRAALLFMTLADKAGDCVSKDALMQAAWPGQLVHENSLAKGISKLRQALAGSELEIEAHYGVGYSLRQAPAEAVARKLAPEEISDQTHNLSGRPAAGARYRPALALTAMVLLSALIGAFALWRFSVTLPVRDTAPVTNDPPNAAATILWVDDHPANNRLDVAYLRRKRVAVHLATTTEDAMNLLAMNSYRLVVSDLGRGEDRLAGLKMAEMMKARHIPVPVIIYTIRPKTPAGELAQREMAFRSGAAGIAVTPKEVRAEIAKQLARAADET